MTRLFVILLMVCCMTFASIGCGGGEKKKDPTTEKKADPTTEKKAGS